MTELILFPGIYSVYMDCNEFQMLISFYELRIEKEPANPFWTVELDWNGEVQNERKNNCQHWY